MRRENDNSNTWACKTWLSRCVVSSQWTSQVKAIFKKYAGIETTPKTLRASYITWLKNQTDAPEILKVHRSAPAPRRIAPRHRALTLCLHADLAGGGDGDASQGGDAG